MKLLFDQNLAPRLVLDFATEFPDSKHVRDEGLASALDFEAWSHAANHRFTIVTKDADFQQMAILRGPPPKVIWLRIGNRSTADVAAVLRTRLAEIRQFEADPAAAILALA